MGDHRASVKIEFQMYGHTRKQEWWINWFPGPGECDRRISEWLARVSQELYEQYYMPTVRESQRTAEERQEREEYERLKAKFEGKEE